jgi:circadian clock protein KaiC
MGAELRAALQPGGALGILRREALELDPDITAYQILDVLDRSGIRRLVVDSSTELEHAVTARSGAERLPDFLAALLATLRTRAITSLLIRETHVTVGAALGFPEEPLWLLAENVLLLQQVIFEGQIRHVLAVLKTRYTEHVYALRQFIVEPSLGIRVLTPDESGDAVLSWIARP